MFNSIELLRVPSIREFSAAVVSCALSLGSPPAQNDIAPESTEVSLASARIEPPKIDDPQDVKVAAPDDGTDLMREKGELRFLLDVRTTELLEYDAEMSDRLQQLRDKERMLLLRDRLLTEDYRVFEKALHERYAGLVAEVQALEAAVTKLAEATNTLKDESTTLRDSIDKTLEESKELAKLLKQDEARAKKLEEEVAATIALIEWCKGETVRYNRMHWHRLGGRREL